MAAEFFPDGTVIDDWFYETAAPRLDAMGKKYDITDYGAADDGGIYTKEIQAAIDTAHADGGGVIIVPPGTYMTGALYFKQDVHLYIMRGGTLKGSDNIADYNLKETRIEGETCLYYDALINAVHNNGFTACGEGVIDGNGLRSWQAFWLRRKWNPNCTNKDEQRPRLVYIADSEDVTVYGLTLQNSHYWTNHLYRCKRVKFIGCKIFSPIKPVPAPSTDAIDLDVCEDVLVKNCRIHVNDDSIVLKGGKGPWADTAPENGANERVVVEDCVYDYCHGCLTCGSESVHNRNIILRRIKVNYAHNMLWLKPRPDTPQLYEYITAEDVEGYAESFININPWMQFYDLKERKDTPLSYADNVTLRRCNLRCDKFFNVTQNDEQYRLSNFTFEDLDISAEDISFDRDLIANVNVSNVILRRIEKD